MKTYEVTTKHAVIKPDGKQLFSFEFDDEVLYIGEPQVYDILKMLPRKKIEDTQE